MLKSINIRIYPNEEQETYIANLLGCTRLVYNTALAWKKSAYEKDKTNLSDNDLSKKITKLKTEKTFLKNVYLNTLQQSIRDLDVAYTNFFSWV
jgi:putative transposase